jgi:HSP20 family protein
MRRMEELLDQTFAGFGWPTQMVEGDGWSPPVDIEERDDAYILEADLPGVKREDVTVEQIGNELSISGEHKETKHTGVLRKATRRTGTFRYRVALPEQIDAAKIDAKLSDGVLTIRLPKAQKAPHKQIEVKGG